MTMPDRLILGLVPWYSVLVVTGMALAVFLAVREERRMGLPKDTILDLALWLLPIGVIGARVYYVVFTWEQYAANPISVLYIWEGGLAIYGGVIAGALTALIFARKRKLSMLTLADAVMPGVALAQAIGRWGNFFNQEAYGVETAAAFWQFFPASVYIESEGAWHLATFFYESVLDAAVFAWLWNRRAFRRNRGDTFLAYLLLYGAGRMLIEGLRTDSLYLSGNLRVSQLLSAGMVLAVCIVWAARAKRRERLCLLLPLSCLGMVIAAGLAGAGLGLLTGLIAIYGAAAVCAVVFFERRTGGWPCRTES